MYIFGIIGMILVQFSTCAQIVKLYRRKKTDGLSVLFLWMIFLGLISYLVYSISIDDKIYIASNSIGLFFLAVSIAQYYYYRYFYKGEEIPYVHPNWIEPHDDDPI